jgi:two-component system NtrC family sensor kinase
MLLNLLFNADEAMALVEPPRGGHKISVETLMHSDDGQDEVTIIISDTGGGIAPADMTRIFDPSYTTKIENGKVRGLGMGLYVSYGLAQAHGGTIDVESLLGQGSRFIICLPAEAKGESAKASDE